MIQTHSKSQLDEEQFQTLFCLAEARVNERPITRNSDAANDLEAPTPNHFLLLRRGMPFLGKDEAVNVYGSKHRQVQSLALQVWSRGRRNTFQIVEIDDFVLVLDVQSLRSKWTLGRVEEVTKGRDELIGTIRVGTQTGCYERRITKIVSLEDI